MAQDAGNDSSTKEVSLFLDKWHKAAAEADEDVFFSSIAEDGIYIGTDDHEHWDKKTFWEFAEPHFQKEKAWDFTPYERHIHHSKDGEFVWFSELLHTWMGTCRGSGVVIKKGKAYKIKQYHLSVTVPNEKIKDFIALVEAGDR